MNLRDVPLLGTGVIFGLVIGELMGLPKIPPIVTIIWIQVGLGLASLGLTAWLRRLA